MNQRLSHVVFFRTLLQEVSIPRPNAEMLDNSSSLKALHLKMADGKIDVRKLSEIM